MGKHGSGTPEVVRRPWPLLTAIAALLVVAALLGWWWWSLRAATDPIGADPVDGFAVVVSSADCPNDSGIVVDLQAPAPEVRGTIDGCGQPDGKRVAVEYLRSDPSQIRLAGTTTATDQGAARWLPLGILAAGVLAVGASLFLLIERRIHHADAAAPITVAELRRRAALPSAVEVGPESAAEVEPVTHAGAEEIEPVPTLIPQQSRRGGVDLWKRDDRQQDITATDELHLGSLSDQAPLTDPSSGDLFTHRGPDSDDS